MIKFNELSAETAEQILNSAISSSLKKFLNSSVQLTEDKIKSYNDFGFVKIENVIDTDFYLKYEKLFKLLSC